MQPPSRPSRLQASFILRLPSGLLKYWSSDPPRRLRSAPVSGTLLNRDPLQQMLQEVQR
jgi:hypothetical protein